VVAGGPRAFLLGIGRHLPLMRAGVLAAEKAGLPGRCKPYGLRKAILRRLAEEGKSVKEIAAVSGHKDLRQVQHYTDAAENELPKQCPSRST
jgi:site-specific recombinase XerD